MTIAVIWCEECLESNTRWLRKDVGKKDRDRPWGGENVEKCVRIINSYFATLR
jgi:hypothetical protein